MRDYFVQKVNKRNYNIICVSRIIYIWPFFLHIEPKVLVLSGPELKLCFDDWQNIKESQVLSRSSGVVQVTTIYLVAITFPFNDNSDTIQSFKLGLSSMWSPFPNLSLQAPNKHLAVIGLTLLHPTSLKPLATFI